ncbi:hypothetical protein YC2023_100313 [Brassica napus]
MEEWVIYREVIRDRMRVRLKHEKRSGGDCRVKAGSIFDNILITDDPQYARTMVDDYFEQHREPNPRDYMDDYHDEL